MFVPCSALDKLAAPAHPHARVSPPDSPSSPGTIAATSPPAKSRPLLKPGTFIKRTFSWIALWIVALWFVFSGWDTG